MLASTMKQTVALLLLLLAAAVPGRGAGVESYTILIGNNTEKPCSVMLHFKNGDNWETKGWWTIEPKNIGTLAQSTDDEIYVFVQRLRSTC